MTVAVMQVRLDVTLHRGARGHPVGCCRAVARGSPTTGSAQLGWPLHLDRPRKHAPDVLDARRGRMARVPTLPVTQGPRADELH
jgi:hypothetical protein